MSSSVPKPKIGCQHFKSLAKQIEAENNTLDSAICDIIDNIHGIGATINDFKALCEINLVYDPKNSSLYKIAITDNIPSGFKDIYKNGTENPLNMGCIRQGQSDDIETSEFGTGLKKAMIFLANHAEIFTRCVDDDEKISFVWIVFDFVEMSNRTNPEESYEPVCFQEISEEIFRKNHPYDTGSSIILSNLKDIDITFDAIKGKFMTCDEFETGFRKEISDKMSDLIRNEVIQITVKGKEVRAKDDLVALVQNNKVNKFYADFNGKGEICEVYRETVTATGRRQIKRYEKNECKFIRGSEDQLNAFKEKQSVKLVEMVSLTTKGTPYQDITKNDVTALKRRGRYFGEVKITKQEKDGYSNHIYHEINYTSKKLNIFLGVGSNKRVVSDKSNILMSAIHVTQKELVKDYRSFCKNMWMPSDSSSDTDGEPVPRPKSKSKPKTKAPKPVLQEEPEDLFVDLMDQPVAEQVEQVAEVAVAQVKLVDLFAALIDEPVAQVMTEIQGELEATELQVMTELQQVPAELKVEVEEQMTISEGIELLNIILGNEKPQIIIEEVTNILTDFYISSNVQAKIALKYVPLNNSRIQMLIEIMEQAHPEEERSQPIDKNIAAAISSLLRLVVE